MFRVEVNGVELPQRRWSPRVRWIVRRTARRQWRPRRFPWRQAALAALLITCSHIAASAFFVPTLRIYTSGSAATETIPSGAFLVSAECWAGGGSGGTGSGSGCTAKGGGGGGSGSFGSTLNSTAGLQNGKTFTYTVGLGGAASSNPGNASSINAGTVTGWGNISTNGGGAGGNTGGAGAAGAAGAGGVTANTAGAAGGVGNSGGQGSGGAGVAGGISGDGGPYGAGGAGGAVGTGHAGIAGQNGAVVFFYH